MISKVPQLKPKSDLKSQIKSLFGFNAIITSMRACLLLKPCYFDSNTMLTVIDTKSHNVRLFSHTDSDYLAARLTQPAYS